MAGELLKNQSSNGWIVQKFGGTSVGKFPDKIAEDIIRKYVETHKLVVVCSARSTGKKTTGTTSRLLEVFKNLKSIVSISSNVATQEELLKVAKVIVHEICSDHVAAVDEFIRDAELATALKEGTKKECQLLVEYLEAAKRFNLEVNSRAKDRVVSFGEKLSCRFMTYLLRDRGVDAEYVDLSDILHCESNHTRLDAPFYKSAATAIADKISLCEGRVPVLTGFFGNVPGSLLDGDVGRGYTDLCASLAAVGLKAAELQIWKEVDGIFTADPTKVPTARLIPSITPSEAAELTFYGSEVIHHLTMDQVIKAQPPIPIRIKNVKNPRGEGTIVKADPLLAADQQIQRPRQPSDPTRRKQPKRPTAVTIKDKISIINIHSNKRSIAHHFLARVFSILNQHKISVDLISTSEVHVSIAVHNGNGSEFGSSFHAAVDDLRDCGDVSVLHDMAILSLVGAEMKNMRGIAGRMFSTLGNNSVNIEMISQGASEINISCVIDAREAERAMNVLHTHLFTFLD